MNIIKFETSYLNEQEKLDIPVVISRFLEKVAENNPQGTANIADDRVLATVPYKFFYKYKYGRMGSKLIEVNIKDNELAIAKSEKENSEIVWRSFTAL